MLVFAHPDDEVVGLGARLTRYRSAVIVHVTDGAPRNDQEIRSHGFLRREDYAACRRRELQCALEFAGLKDAPKICLNIADQEASLHLVELIRELHRLVTIHEPEVIFTHPYEGGHPDHDACAFAVQRAVSLVQAEGKCSPMIIEPAFYHLGPRGIETGCFLQNNEVTDVILCPLSPEERNHKEQLLACFPSQRETLCYFAPTHEHFRIAPQYDFHEPPHAAQVFYEHYPWGMTTQRFCQLTRAADLAEAVCP